jgi:hypothetical protein
VHRRIRVSNGHAILGEILIRRRRCLDWRETVAGVLSDLIDDDQNDRDDQRSADSPEEDHAVTAIASILLFPLAARHATLLPAALA